eukprot:TRINITY_DN27078_c0_g1_i2.p1 TRINITY_DN27078_c0_g1~~TRINITY_DN27078_c0_g1_i2.p1  ORF type:complete len:470 (-),score=75.20 TRINITY_DN27078_c0_g1_i2:44-1453(-)
MLDTSGQMDGEDLVKAFEKAFPELCPEHGTYARFKDRGGEVHRCRALKSMVSLVFLLGNRYGEFVQSQRAEKRMSEATWHLLQNFISWVGIRSDTRKVHILLVLLAIRDLARVKALVMQFPEHCQQMDAAAQHIVEELPQFVPSMSLLDDEGICLVSSILMMNQELIFGQFLQAECSPVAVAKLGIIFSEETALLPQGSASQGLQLFLSGALCAMCSLIPTEPEKGSAFMDEQNTQSVLQALQALQKQQDMSPQEVYWDYIDKRAKSLGLPTERDEDVAFIRLVCLCRAQAMEDLTTTWMALDASDRDSIVNCLLADAMHESSLLFVFLPACFANAKDNSVLGYAPMFLLLADLIDLCLFQAKLQEQDDDDSSELVVDLSDLASFAMAVKDAGVFESCLSRAKLEQSSHNLRLNMSAANWSLVDSEEHLVMSVRLRMLLRRKRSIMKRRSTAAPHASNHIEYGIYSDRL